MVCRRVYLRLSHADCERESGDFVLLFGDMVYRRVGRITQGFNVRGQMVVGRGEVLFDCTEFIESEQVLEEIEQVGSYFLVLIVGELRRFEECSADIIRTFEFCAFAIFVFVPEVYFFVLPHGGALKIVVVIYTELV